MKTFTNYAEKKAKQFLNLLQGYTKGIRITAILILLLMGVNNAWAEPWLCRSTAGGKIATKTVGDKLNNGNEWNYEYTTNGGWSSATDIQVYVGTSTSSYTTVNAGWKSDDGANKNVAANIGNVSFDKSGKWYAVGKYRAGGKTAYTTKKDEWTNNTTLSMGSNDEPYWEVTPPAVSNFTVSVSGYLSGTGTSNDPYIVQYGKALTVNLSGSQAKTDANSTLQYNTSGTWNTTTSRTISNITSATKTSVTVKMRCHNSTASLSGTESSKTIYYRAEDVHTVTINNDGHGTTSPSGAQSNVGQVTGLSIKATPAANYEFVNWTITRGSGSFGSTTSASTTFKPTSAATIQANFRSTATHSLNVVAGNGISQVAGSTDPVTLGNTYDIKATPKTGYTFSTWTANPTANATFGSETTANTTVTVKNGSVTVTATGKEQLYALTTANSYSTGNPGYTSPTKSRNDIGVETIAEVTATAAGADYIFTGWTLTNCERTDGGADNAATITIRANGNGAAKVTANYTAKTLVRLYYYNNNNWSKVYAYIWNPTTNGNNANWPGVEITSNAEETNCTKYYYYEYYQEDHPGWSRIVFSNGSGSQTSDITYDATTHNGQYYFVDKWVATPTVIWTFAGTMNNWDTNTNPLVCTSATSGYVEFTLDANTEYKFKFVNKIEKNEDTWYGVSSVTQITYSNQATAQTMNNTSGSSDQTMLTAGAGIYRFTWDVTNKKVTVTYPTSYTVTYSRTPTAAADAPTTAPSITSGKYVAAGTSVTFTAKTAKTGYTFKGWYDNDKGTGAALSNNLAYTCTINADTKIYAVYTVNTYNIAIVANPTEAAESLTASPQAVGAEKVNISTTAKFTYKFDNWTATDGITITDASNPSTSITATKAGTVTANFTQLQPTTVYLKPNTEWKQSDARFAIHYWHDGQPAGWVDMTDAGCNRDYFVATIPAGYTNFLFARMDPSNTENKWDADIDWNKTGDLTIPTDGKNLFTLPTSGDQVWNGATGTWGTYTPPTYTININAPEAGSIAVTVGGNTTTVTNTPKQITDIAAGTTFTIAYTPNEGFELGHSEVEGIKETYAGAGTYTVCGPVDITAHFVTTDEQVVYLRPNGTWLSDNALFYAYAFNRYGDDEWIELTTKETDYTGAFSGTIPAGYSDVIFVRINPTATEPSWDDDVKWNQSVDYVIPVNSTDNRFIIGEKVTSGGDKDKYQGSWEASNTPIYGIPGDWQGDDWSADEYPLMGPYGKVTVNITHTNDTLGFKVYRYPYGTDQNSSKWLGNNGTMTRGGEGVHEGGWTMETDKDDCGLAVDVAGNYVFHFNIRESKLTVQYPPMPVPATITLSAQRVFEDAPLNWIAGNGTEANPYQLYVDEAARFTVTPLADVPGLTACYRVGDDEEQTSNIIDFTNILTKDTAYTVYVYYKNAAGATSDTVTVQTPYIKGLPMPFYLMTSPSQEINVDRIAAGENITVQFRSDAAATVGLYLQINNDEAETKLTDITNSISKDYTHDVDNNIEPCILHYIARSTAAVHGRTFEAKADVAIYKNVIIKVNDPEGWVKNAYMWRDYSDAVKTQWPGEPVLQNFGTWRVFSVKYPYYDRFIVNEGLQEGGKQTLDWILPADDTCYELLDPADNGSDKEEDKGKYGLKVADCPENLLVEDIKDTTIMEGEQIVVMPKIFVGLGYQVADIEASVYYDNTRSIKAMMSGTNVTILGNAEGESKVTVTYILDNVRIEKTFKVTVTKRTKITIQVKVPTEHGPEADRIGWWENDKIYVRYWNAQNGGTDQKMNYLTQTDYHYYFEATIPLDDTGKTNFNIFYDNRNEDWRYSTNATDVTEDGCYLVYNDGSGDRGLRYEGVRCLTDQYQVRIAMGSGKTFTSNIVTAEEDTLSFFAPGMNETGYKAGVIMLYQNDKMIATIEPSTFAKSDVYTATLNDALNGLDNVSTYSGNFYIRTYGTSHANIGFNNGKGWNSIKDLTAVEKDSVRFTKFASREGEFYNHYWVQAMNTGTFDGKDVSACVANEYNDDLAGKLLQDKHTNEYGDIKVGSGKVINVRFGYDPRTNYFGRAILQGSEFDTYLNIHCDNAYRDKDCTKKFPYGTSTIDNKMYDISTWVYQRDIYVPIDNSHPSASLYLEATSPSTERTVTDHLLGYVKNDVTGEDTSTPIQKLVIGSGTTNGTYLIRVVYDFKTNRLIAAWLPQGTVDVKDDRTLHADVLFVRKENETVPQVQLAEEGKIRSLETMYFALELERGDANKANRHEEQYLFTLPFNSLVGSISGVPGYMQTWGIQRYRGDLRAKHGLYLETPTYWQWLSTTDTLYAGEGYLLVFDKKAAPFEEIEVDKMDSEGNIIDGQKEKISMMRLYFASDITGFDMQPQSALQLKDTFPDHTCTLTLHDRNKYDSNWKVIGTNSYSNAGVKSATKDNEDYVDKDPTDGREGFPKFRYLYKPEMSNDNKTFTYSYVPEDGEKSIYNSFFAYMVQFAGIIEWEPVMSETVPEGIAARRYVAEGERTSYTTRLELANATGEKQDQTFVALDKTGTTGFDQNKDLNKVINLGANIYTLSEDVPYAGNTLAMEKQTVPVGVVIAEAGEYTFRMPDGTDGISVTLVDNVTGTHTDMLMDEYTITLDAGTIENRFYLVVDPDRTATSVENVGEEAKGEETKGQIKKFLIDGKLFIRTADGIFDAKGQRL